MRTKHLTPDGIAQAAADLCPSFSSPYGLEVTLDLSDNDPRIVLAEAERTVIARASDLAAWTRDRPATTPARAIEQWVNLRPVSDAEAAAAGMAVLGWKPRHRRVGWAVVADRPDSPVRWIPQGSGAPDVLATRVAALARSRELPATVRCEGPVAIWACPGKPALTTAILADPDRLLAEAAALGLHADPAAFVVSVPGAVACATPANARRLASELAQRNAVLSLTDLDLLEWL